MLGRRFLCRIVKRGEFLLTSLCFTVLSPLRGVDQHVGETRRKLAIQVARIGDTQSYTLAFLRCQYGFSLAAWLALNKWTRQPGNSCWPLLATPFNNRGDLISEPPATHLRGDKKRKEDLARAPLPQA
jgi:hypothetical protein